MSLKNVARYVLIIPFLTILAIVMFIAMDFERDYYKRGVSKYYVTHGVEDTGALNLVTAIYLNYRAYDTLGETTVLFVAVLGVTYLLRLSYEKKRDKNS